jgi:hypothetical protein
MSGRSTPSMGFGTNISFNVNVRLWPQHLIYLYENILQSECSITTTAIGVQYTKSDYAITETK